MRTESQLVERAKAKDPKALNEIYMTYYPKMVGVCRKIVKEDGDVVHDLVHDAFVLAFASLDALRDNDRFGEWLTTIVRNVAMKYLARKKRQRIVPLSQVNANDAAFIDDAPAADSELNRQDILDLVARLPEGYGRVFRLSVIEGLSHKEIADMLGIKPRSSSSQLARARAMLVHNLGYGVLGVVMVVLVCVPLYLFMSRREEPDVCDIRPVMRKVEVPEEPLAQDSMPQPAPQPQPVIRKDVVEDIPDTTLLPPPVHEETPSIAEEEAPVPETAEDSLLTPVSADHEPLLAEDIKPKRDRKWRFLAMGSLGPALAQNVGRLFAGGSLVDGDGEAPSPVPENIHTWEEYSEYLKQKQHAGTPADTLALMDIAAHNSGKIIEREQHDKPITFGVSLSKSLTDRWSLETGLQYTLLRSRFTMGEDGYAIVRRQKAHYLGVPLKVSYRMLEYKRLSAYAAAGVTLHIPVHGKMSGNYVVGGQPTDSSSYHFMPSFQWQTNLSAGVQYRFTPHVGVFVEPTFNWFIPSGSSTHTIWTEHPVMFTCPFGIRVNW